jgi:hypothetical protein
MEDYIYAHKYSIHNRKLLNKDKICGCFYCLTIFDPKEITEWVDCEDDTAICPYCGIDAVLSQSSCSQITKEFLKKMQDYWFDGVKFRKDF